MADYTIKRLEEVQRRPRGLPGRDADDLRAISTPSRSPSPTGECLNTREARESYGHRHKEQEEVYFVASGKLQFKLDDDIVDLERGSAVRVAPETWRSVWNDEPEDAEAHHRPPRSCPAAPPTTPSISRTSGPE